jgi:hypothetical protein
MNYQQNIPARATNTESIEKATFELTLETTTKIGLRIHVITDPSKILELRKYIGDFVNKWSQNPFFLPGFTSKFMESNRLKNGTPFVLVVTANDEIIGIVPLMIKTILGIRFAKFFPAYTFSPDFVIDDRYREDCIEYILEYLFKKQNCLFATFGFSSESPNLKIIKQQCKKYGIGFSNDSQLNQKIIPIENSWDEFLKKKGRRRIIRQMERKIDQIGPWNIKCIENVINRPDVLEKILDVEKMSWKESWRNTMQIEKDEILLMTWEGSQIEAKTTKDFKCSAWFLEIKGETVAYTLVTKYKGTAFIGKTTYDNRFKKFYIGKYIMFATIRDLFNDGQINTINFMGDFPFMSFWTSSSLNHVKVSLCKGKFGKLMEKLHIDTFMIKILKFISNNLPYTQKHLVKALFAALT